MNEKKLLQQWFIGAKSDFPGRCDDVRCCSYQFYNPNCGVFGCDPKTGCNHQYDAHYCAKCKTRPSNHRSIHCPTILKKVPSTQVLTHGVTSDGVGCFLLRKNKHGNLQVLAQCRGINMNQNPNKISNPGGHVEPGDDDFDTVNKELAEETLKAYNPSQMLKWHLLLTNNYVYKNKPVTSRYYWADGSALKIKGPDNDNEEEINRDCDWSVLNQFNIDYEILRHNNKNTGHAWLSIQKIPLRRTQKQVPIFVQAFLGGIDELKKIETI